jgi:hypothetical protein
MIRPVSLNAKVGPCRAMQRAGKADPARLSVVPRASATGATPPPSRAKYLEKGFKDRLRLSEPVNAINYELEVAAVFFPEAVKPVIFHRRPGVETGGLLEKLHPNPEIQA